MRTIANVSAATVNTILSTGFKYETSQQKNDDGTVNLSFTCYAGFETFRKERLQAEYTLGHLYQVAYHAYSGTSFSPEKRATDLLISYSQELDQDIKLITEKAGEEEAARYKENYIKYLTAWLQAKSRCLSSMITGPANFPTRRNEKANQSERKRGEEFTDWRDRALKSIDRKIEAAKPQAQKDNERFELLKKDICSSAAVIAGIDNGTQRGYSRALFVNSIAGKIKTLAKNGETDLVNRCLELIKELNSQAAKPIITAKNGIWQLEQKAEAAREQAYDQAQRESKEIAFKGGKVVINYQADRLQIVFDEKPGADMRSTLKSNAYKWAPSAGVWQRKLTNNAVYCLRFLNLPQVEKAEA